MIDTINSDSQNRQVATWLFVCCGLVFAMVILGGVTRLTGSGLSMVDWKPIMGWLPPLNDAEWQRAFDMYKLSPEFLKVNSHMDVNAFKGIFWLEFLHRLLGRTIGIVFALPFIYFLAKGYVVRREWPKYLLMFVLGGLQGVLGWYMVKSGLIDNPHVSQYRLTAHLVAAVLIYAYMFWVGLSLLHAKSAEQHHAWRGRTLICVSPNSIGANAENCIVSRYDKPATRWSNWQRSGAGRSTESNAGSHRLTFVTVSCNQPVGA